MEIYFIIYGILLMLSLIEVNRKKQYSNGLKGFVFSFLAIFLAIRYNVGNDYEAYHYVLTNIDTLDTYFEPGFTVLYKVLDLPPELYFGVLSLISFFLLYKIFNYFEPRYTITALLLYYSVHLVILNLHYIRQGIAVLLFAYALVYLYKSRYLEVTLLVILAFLFHKSIAVIIPFLFLIKSRIRRDHRYLIVGISLVFYAMVVLFRQEIFSLMNSFSLTQRFAEVYNNQRYGLSYGLSLGVLSDIALFAFVNSRKDLSRKESFLLNVFTVSLMLTIMLNDLSIALRLAYFFRFVNVFLFIALLRIKPRVIFELSLILFTGYYLYRNFYIGTVRLDYQTIFSLDRYQGLF